MDEDLEIAISAGFGERIMNYRHEISLGAKI